MQHTLRCRPAICTTDMLGLIILPDSMVGLCSRTTMHCKENDIFQNWCAAPLLSGPFVLVIAPRFSVITRIHRKPMGYSSLLWH